MPKRRILVLTADRAERGLLEPIMKELEMRDDVEAKWGELRNNYEWGTADNIYKLRDLFHSFRTNPNDSGEEGKPDIIVCPTDRAEMVYVAAYAFHMGYVIAHFHAGNNPTNHPDDLNRKAISTFSHIMFANMDQHKRNLIYQGEEAWRIKVVGSTAFDHVDYDNSVTPKGAYTVVILHPDPASAENTKKDLDATLKYAQLSPKVVWIYPNKDKHREIITDFLERKDVAYMQPPVVTIHKNLPKGQYLDLLKNCADAVGNSSSFYYELPVLNPKALMKQIGERNKGLVVPPTVPGGSKRIAEILATIPLDEKLRKKWCPNG